jgi:hypothetical protein
MIRQPPLKPEAAMDRKLDFQGALILVIGWIVALYTTLS